MKENATEERKTTPVSLRERLLQKAQEWRESSAEGKEFAEGLFQEWFKSKPFSQSPSLREKVDNSMDNFSKVFGAIPLVTIMGPVWIYDSLVMKITTALERRLKTNS